MAKSFWLRWGLMIALVLAAGTARAQEDGNGVITYGGIERSYYIHFPPGYDGTAPAPLFIMLHGATMSGVEMMLISDFNTVADQTGTITAYPDSRGAYWIYMDEDELAAGEDYHDDVGFIAALIDHLSGNYAIDADRVYVAGYSSGGMMALRLRCTMPDRISGFAVIGASFSYDLAQHCLNSSPAPVLIVLGTQDAAFPSLGYARVTPGGGLDSVFSLNQVMTFLSTLNGCIQSITTEEVTSANGSVRVLHHTYQDCPNNAQVGLYSLIDWNHDWPGYEIIDLGSDGMDETIRDAIWDFFREHGLEDASSPASS